MMPLAAKSTARVGSSNSGKDWLLIFTKCYADAHATALSGHTQADADDCGAKVNDQAKKHHAAAEVKKAQKSKQDH